MQYNAAHYEGHKIQWLKYDTGDNNGTSSVVQKALAERMLMLREFLRGQSPEVITQLRSVQCSNASSPESNRLVAAVYALQSLFPRKDSTSASSGSASTSSLFSRNRKPSSSLQRSRRATNTEREIVASAARVMRTMRQELYREEENEKVPVRRVVRTLVDDPPDFMTQMVRGGLLLSSV